VEWDKGGLIIPRAEGLQVQMYDVVKGVDPTTHIRICSGGGREAIDEEIVRVMSGRGRWVRKCFLPQFDVGSRGVEFDASEEVPSCPLHPQLGDDATRFERRPFVTYVVEDEVEDLRREEGRHRGLCQSCLDAVFHRGVDSVRGSNPVLSSILQYSCTLRTLLIANDNTVVSDLHPLKSARG
jgi:hypothetical protein